MFCSSCFYFILLFIFYFSFILFIYIYILFNLILFIKAGWSSFNSVTSACNCRHFAHSNSDSACNCRHSANSNPTSDLYCATSSLLIAAMRSLDSVAASHSAERRPYIRASPRCFLRITSVNDRYTKSHRSMTAVFKNTQRPLYKITSVHDRDIQKPYHTVNLFHPF